MTDPVTPPPEEVAATVLGVQHLGPHYLWNGSNTEIVDIDSWVGNTAWYYHFGGERLCSTDEGDKILGRVPMPPAGDPGSSGDRLGPTGTIAGAIVAAYQSGKIAERSGMSDEHQALARGNIHDRVVQIVAEMLPTAGVPLTTRGLELSGVVDKIVRRAHAAGVERSDGAGGVAEWGLQEHIESLVAEAVNELEPRLSRPDPHHEDEARRTYGRADYVSWNGENASLRRTLLWLAGRAEVTSETRRLLRERISTGADRVVADAQEDEHVQVLDFRKLVDELCALVEAAVARDIRESSSLTFENKGRLPLYWNAKAANRAEMLRSALEDLPEIHTLAGLRFA